VLNDLHQYKAADSTLNVLIKADPQNAEARSVDDRVKDNASINKVSLSYDYIYFDKEFNTPWNVVELDYSRQTRWGSIIGTLNYANRFSTNGLQYEVDAYPHISKVFYAYVSAAYSGNVSVFPKARAGFSLYANLPNSFEAELGTRYLYFSTSTWIYTAAIGKYYKNWRFTLRTYQTPSYGSLSQSYSVNARYYFGGAFDYLGLTLGTGVSPDDPRNIILLNNGVNYKLSSDNVSAAYYHTIKRNIFFISLSLENQEYAFDTRGNQLDIGIGYQRRF
jgi:YaiO family outer membrane protein